MGKLKDLFENLDNPDKIKQTYFAEKIIEHFLLMEGKITEAYDLDFIKEKIIKESMKNSLDESLSFVDGIFEQVNEGFVSTLADIGKSAWKKIKNVATAIKDAIKQLWAPTTNIVHEWNKNIIQSINRLENITLNDSFINTETSYLFEADEETTDNGNTEEVSVNKKINKIVTILNKKIVEPMDTGLNIPGFKMFKVTKEDEKILYFGDDETTLIPMIKYNKIKHSIIIMVPKKVDAKTMNTLTLIVTTIKNNEEFGLNDIITNVENSTNTLTISANGKQKDIRPGKNLMVMKGKISFVDDVGTELEQTPDGEEQSDTTNPTIETNKKIIDDSINMFDIKTDTTIYELIGTTVDDTWNTFNSFAKNNGYKITSILRNTNGDLNSAYPFKEPEYLAYISNMKSFVNGLINQPAQDGYDEKAYKVFLNSILIPTNKLDSDVRSLINSKNKKNVKKTNTTIKEYSVDDIIKQLDTLTQEELQYILSKVTV